MNAILIQKRETVNRFIVNSATDGRRRYVVLRQSQHNWKCSCPRWIFGVKQADGSRRRLPCKHIFAVKAMVGTSGQRGVA
jgi:predicted nucleic acid-binding Zn finger protein